VAPVVVGAIAEACQTGCRHDKPGERLEPPQESGFLACCTSSGDYGGLMLPSRWLPLGNAGAARPMTESMCPGRTACFILSDFR
jgi:hypothetical protein